MISIFHDFSGWLVFVAAFGLLFVVVRLLMLLAKTAAQSKVEVADVA